MWFDRVVELYSRAHGLITIHHAVIATLGREPDVIEMEVAEYAVRRHAAWPAEADVEFEPPPAPEAAYGQRVGGRQGRP